MRTLFELCQPRPDVARGVIAESDFAADLAQVLRQEAPKEYQEPALFFANTHPTAGLKRLLDSVCRRITGRGGEASSIFRLDTQYGGGKTHALIALLHAARGMRGVANPDEFLDRSLIPSRNVRVAAFDGENADPVNGRSLGQGVRAFTPWGELAYALGGPAGFERIKQSDLERVAPGADTIRELFGGEPSLILLDELSIYLRKIRGRREEGQLTAFLNSLFKAVESAPGAALVFTLAVAKKDRFADAYAPENDAISKQIEEAQSVAARKATLLDPTAESEVAQVLRRRLFAQIDSEGAREVLDAYRALWNAHRNDLPIERQDESRFDEFERGYPLHPALMGVLTDKLSTLANFQRVRGMLRLMAQTVARVWNQKPPHTYAIHLHHVDPGFDAIRNEIVTRLELASFDPAIRNDVAAPSGGASLAQELDARQYAGLPPYASLVARTVLWHSFAFNDPLKGASPEELRFACLGPGLDVGFVNDARQRFVEAASFLDDRPAAPLRFLTEANLNQLVRRQETRIDAADAQALLSDEIKRTFSKGPFELVAFAAEAGDVRDDVGGGLPLLVLLHHDAESVRGGTLSVPPLVERIFRTKGAHGDFRGLQNNLLFLVADGPSIQAMKEKVVRKLAIQALKAERLAELPEHQQRQLKERCLRTQQELALAIQHCYRHLFCPSKSDRIQGAAVDLSHAAFDLTSTAEKPGVGQQQVLRALVDQRKVVQPDDAPFSAAYTRDRTPLKRGQISTAELRAEFRKDPSLPIMLGDDCFVKLVRQGIDRGEFIYRSGDLLTGPGDPQCQIRIDEQTLIFTASYAKEHGIWPRPAPVQKPGDPVIHIDPEPPAPAPTPTEPLQGQEFSAEAPLRQALTQIWEQARSARVGGLSVLSLRVFDSNDAFRLQAAAGAVTASHKIVSIQAAYETPGGGELELRFQGPPAEAQPVREFLEPQFRVASEKDLTTVYTFNFETGLALTGDEPEKLTEKLARYATGTAYVEARARV